jgi:hypothetical protein
MNNKYVFIALCIVSLSFVPGFAKADDFAQFHINVDLSKMLVDRAKVACQVSGLAQPVNGSTEFLLSNGAFRGVVTVHVNLTNPEDGSRLDKWRCYLMLFKNGTWKGLYNNNAASNESWLHSKSGSQLVWEMDGDLRTPQASVAGHGVSTRVPGR